MEGLAGVVSRLCSSVDGVDWDAAVTDGLVRQMLELAKRAGPDELSEALALIVARLDRATLEDGDGVAHVAISGGTLVEAGAAPGPLAEALMRHIPDVLEASRRFADTCIADGGTGAADEPIIAEVDGFAIQRSLFRRHLAKDRAGGCALAYLEQWVLPTVAALTRDRESHVRATATVGLLEKAAAMRDSHAYWLHPLFATQLDATWRAISVEHGRGFELRVDGVATNFELNALVADALVEAGIPGDRNPPGVIDVVRGRRDHAHPGFVKGCFQLYTVEAAKHLPGSNVPLEHWVWNEGAPTDVPSFEGMPTLLVTAPTIARTWNAGRPFSHLYADVKVLRELDPAEVGRLVGDMKS